LVHKCNKEKEIAEIRTDLKYLIKIVEDIKLSVKLNSEFRLKANGIIGGIAFICTIAGTCIMWLIIKFTDVIKGGK